MTVSDIDLTKKYSYADYLTWTFDQTIEIIRGKISQMAAPLSNHQDASGNLHAVFKVYLKGKACKVYAAPFDVRLPKPQSQRKTDRDIESVVQPDICVVCDLKKIDRRGCLGAPDLIVEVLSKGTADKDYKEKFGLYEESGVLEYWIVSVEDRAVHVYRMGPQAKFVADHRPYVGGDHIKVGIFEGFSVAVADVFEGLLDFEDE